MKKLLTIMLSLVMLFTMSATVFAAESSVNTISGIVITEDSESVRVAEVVDEEYRYVFTYDKGNNTMTSERFNLDNELEVTAVVNVNDETIYDSKTNTTVSTRAVITSKYTESIYGYEYANSNPKEWKLTRAKYAYESNDAGYYFKAKQTATNKSDLDNFRIAVDKIASKESTLKVQVGITAFLGGCSTGFAIGAGPAGWGIAVSGYLAAAGFGVAAQATATEIGEWQATALARYTDVKNESSIYF